MRDTYIIFFEFSAIHYKYFCYYGNLDMIWNVYSVRHKGSNSVLVSLTGWKRLMHQDCSKEKELTSEMKLNPLALLSPSSHLHLGCSQRDMHLGLTCFVPSDWVPVVSCSCGCDETILKAMKLLCFQTSIYSIAHIARCYTQAWLVKK